MNEFIEVTNVGGKLITIKTSTIVYFKPSKNSRNNNGTEILVHGILYPFVVEECYEDVKSKIYCYEDSALGYDQILADFIKREPTDNSEDNEKETKENKLNVIESDYRATIKEYIEDDNTVFVDYKKLNLDNYGTAYKNFLMTHPVSISNDKEIIGYIKIGKFKNNNSEILIYMIDKYGYIFNTIFYNVYIGCDIISEYLHDLINKSKDGDPINEHCELIVEFPEAVENEETEDNKEFNIIIGGYISTVGDYIKDDNYFIDYRKLYNDRDYRIAYKNFLKTHIFQIYDINSTEESIGYLHLDTYKGSSNIDMYMSNIYDEVYNVIYYEEKEYMNCDIITKYLKDCMTLGNMYMINKDYKLYVFPNEDN